MYRMGSVLLILLTVSLVGFSAIAQDDLKPLVRKGESAIISGDYQSALDYFQQVVQKLQDLVGAAFEQYMPKVLPGWEAGELERNSWAGTTQDFSGNMVNLTQEFKRTSDGKVCEVNLLNWPQTVNSMRKSFEMYKQMGDMLNADPNVNITIKDQGTWTIVRVVEKEADRTQVQAICENALITIAINYANAPEADQILQGMDLAGIDKQAQR